ncbi:MAG: RimK family protein [Gammaproteobacteria bacterium]|nr:RimK family protein [Gammaproteobacteria bacterium]
MSKQIFVVENQRDARMLPEAAVVVDVDEYLTGTQYFKQKNIQVINLCRNYRYQSVGYYCSLLAEARRHRVLPSVKTMLDLSSKAMYSLDATRLDKAVEKAMAKLEAADESLLVVDLYFGQCRLQVLAELSRQIFEIFAAPLLRVEFRRSDHWHIASIKALPIHKLKPTEREDFLSALAVYLKRRTRHRQPQSMRYDLAMLINPADPQPPSNKRALERFINAGKEVGINVELIERKDYARLAEYDALFIRDTTRIDHYTYRFAKKAESEGMVVIDDPMSILRCTNKVYLAELLRANRIPAPKTVIAGRQDLDAAEAQIGYPMVLKVPDGFFSQGVFKAEDRAQLEEKAAVLFKQSELILVQEYIYTQYDWRIGILNHEPLYACQYFMSAKHWQIVHYHQDGGVSEGGFQTLPVDRVPAEVLEVALKAVKHIGPSLYGVDLKQTDKGLFVIEVNDNPNIDAGIEDKVLKDELYRRVMAEFVTRLERRYAA